MAIAHDVFNQYADNAYPGQLHDRSMADVVSRVAEGSDIGYGLAVHETSYRSARIPTGSEVSQGVTVRETVTDNDPTDSPTYFQGETMSAVRVGRVWVKTVDGAAYNDSVYVVPDTGELTNASTDNTQLPNAAFKSEADADGLALVQLNGTE